MGSIFAQPLAAGRGSRRRRGRGRRSSPTAATALAALGGAATLCLGAEREGLPDEVLAAMRGRR